MVVRAGLYHKIETTGVPSEGPPIMLLRSFLLFKLNVSL